MTHDLRMPGDYEYQSLYHGFIAQRQWNKNKLDLISYLRFLKKSDILLDAGCGSGNAVLFYSRKVKKVEGWDINPNSIAFLNKRLKDKKITNAKASVHNLIKERGKAKFSKIILSEVIEHFSESDYKKMLKNLYVLLKKNGEVFITTPNDNSLWPLLEVILNLLQKIKKIPTLEDRHIAHFTKNKLEDIVKESGFMIKKSGSLNFISPFCIFLPDTWRDRINVWESKYFSFGGLLYITAEKK